MNLPGFHTKNKGVNSIMYFCRTNYQKENNNPEEPNGMIIGVFWLFYSQSLP
jgi:hypothetical protein